MSDHRISPRAEQIFQDHLRKIVLRTDRMFCWLLIGQWLFGIAIALIWSPRTWIAEHWSVHQHVIAAALLGALFAAYPIYCIFRQPGTRWTRHVVAVGQMLQSALLVHVTGGRIETHFHVFGSLALLAFYRDWPVLITGTAVVYLDHLALGIWFPLSVYGVEAASFWRSAEHAFWVIFEVVFLAKACRVGIQELSAIADRQAELEQAKDVLESRVEERTRSLTKEVNERREAQEALSRQTRVLQSILHSIGEAVIVADPTGKLVLVNPTAERLVGSSITDTAWQTWPKQYGILCTDKVTPYPAEQLPLVRAIRGEACDEVEVFLSPRQDSSGIFLSCNARPIRNEADTLQGGVVVFHDITERKLAEQALAERALLSALTADVALTLTANDNLRGVLQRCADIVVHHLDAFLVCIWTVDEKDQLLVLQAKAGLDAPVEVLAERVLVGHGEIGRIAQNRRAELCNDVHTAGGNISKWAQRQGLSAFAGYPLSIGERVVGVMVILTRQPLLQTTFDGLAGIADNIALGIERSQAAQVLAETQQAKVMAEAANQAKSEFLSRMSHELRTPLNAVLGFGQLLEMCALTDEQRECVEQINRGGKHLLSLINEVLDIARIEAGRMELSLEPVRVGDVFQEVLDLARPLAAQRGVHLHVDLEGAGSFCVQADNQKLKQVLLNLLSNAVKYNRAHGEVRLSCESAGPARLRLTVSDTGLGIPSDKLPRLFVPFDRLGAEQSGIEGSGLGLTLSKSLVELMEGNLTVASTVGEGSRFSIELPRAESPESAETTATDGIGTWDEESTQAATILYIEDNLDNLRLIQCILARLPGIHLLSAMQGSLGIDLARQHRPNLILLDVHLPDMDGAQVLHRLKADPETQSIPVVVISADATLRQHERLLAAGAHDYLTKPLDIPQFRKILDEMLTAGTIA